MGAMVGGGKEAAATCDGCGAETGDGAALGKGVWSDGTCDACGAGCVADITGSLIIVCLVPQ
ncbi:MAG: hypothetical protein LBB35_02225 [Coriobacteriaceae bacterium]|nr:hypothetical protein [Coriobacteriaceae bacterium]